MIATPKASFTALNELLDLFRTIDPDIQANHIQVFLVVAAHGGAEGISMQEIEKRVDQSQSAVSRNVAMFTDWTRLRTPGPGLVQRTEDLMNRRQKLVRLTPLGERFAAKVLAALAGESLKG